jgi:hypothetical protein
MFTVVFHLTSYILKTANGDNFTRVTYAGL